MEAIEIIREIETNNNPFIDGLDYYMDCRVTVNNVRTRCEQISIVQCDMHDYGRTGIHLLLELRRGEWITWVFLDEIESLEVNEYK
ncbi:hypothetical protein [uncultured Methanobrevibacter sp.]|uniref:hypothetical protein n=1 Tax=uncultured Methanobrevibacter sp. TaxID=253161 RepID=UPI0025CB806A|nr:hypothetical protein [uncultured Methanobrevibacter sp.]